MGTVCYLATWVLPVCYLFAQVVSTWSLHGRYLAVTWLPGCYLVTCSLPGRYRMLPVIFYALSVSYVLVTVPFGRLFIVSGRPSALSYGIFFLILSFGYRERLPKGWPISPFGGILTVRYK